MVVVLCCFAVSAASVVSAGEEVIEKTAENTVQTSYKPDQTAVTVMAGLRGHATGIGLDVNASYLLMNIGLSAMSWDENNESNTKTNEIILYGGVGIANVLQFQLGLSSETQLLIRIRSDIPLTLTESAWKTFQESNQYWSVTPFIELPLSRHRGAAVGLGLGYTF